uniref:Uncharacterized protein n=1 Tax=Myoviridae sp. ctLnO19 TaxID=2825085 RepID=A0A8S5P141_9CAUD|nr:MAG TPA: hypothetical protein [Myoviridae sp. ctLnO19]
MSKINRNRIVLFVVFFAIAIVANMAMNAVIENQYTQYFQVLNFKGISFLISAVVASIPGFVILVNHYSRKNEF